MVSAFRGQGLNVLPPRRISAACDDRASRARERGASGLSKISTRARGDGAGLFHFGEEMQFNSNGYGACREIQRHHGSNVVKGGTTSGSSAPCFRA
jgi:hypothetical protein